MPTSILATKLYIPPLRPNLVRRPRLIDRLNTGLHGKLTLVSAPAGFGKTTLIGEWIDSCAQRVAWLSLDEEESDPARFLTYLVAALQTLAAAMGEGVLGALQSPQPPSMTTLLTSLLNEIATLPDHCLLVLDDYHLVDAGVPLGAVDQALTFLLEHLPPQIHLVITTREDPPLPLARLRAKAQLTEVRAADLRFTRDEAAAFLNQATGLHLTAQEVDALEARTEGWIAGLQLAAVSMQGHLTGEHDRATFIQSFTGSHRFVMDYLLEEVLHQQPPAIQTFLLYTAILDRMCGPLCDAIMGEGRLETGEGRLEIASLPSPVSPLPSQTLLEVLEQANLFLVPLDNERRWYRYHHLFGELLRQRLHQQLANAGEEHPSIAELHIRASQWYEAQGLEVEAFHHATAAHDFARAERLIEGKGMPLHFRGVVLPVLTWLESLPQHVLDAWPSLWTAYASTLLVTGQASRVEDKLQAAEAVLQRSTMDDKARDLIGRVAAIRSTVAAGRQQVDAIITQSRRALDYLHPDNLAFRTSTNWKLGYAYHLQGNRTEAERAYREVITTGQASKNIIFTIMATIGLGGIQEAENQLDLASESYRRALHLFGDQPLPSASEAHLGLARICYERNDLVAAQDHAQQGIQLAHQLEKSDRIVWGELLLARLMLVQGDMAGATVRLIKAEQVARQHHWMRCLVEVTAAQVVALLAQGRISEAMRLAQTHEHPVSLARVHLAQGDPAAALAVLAPRQQAIAAQGRADERLRVMVLQALALHAHQEQEQAMQLLGEALTLAEPSGYIRLFVDEGPPLARLLAHLLPYAVMHGVTPAYLRHLLALFATERQTDGDDAALSSSASDQALIAQPAFLIEPLSDREVEVLHLIAAGHKNQEIADELVVSLNTVRYHTKNLYGKLGVNKRTQAVAKAQELGLI